MRAVRRAAAREMSLVCSYLARAWDSPRGLQIQVLHESIRRQMFAPGCLIGLPIPTQSLATC
jgi:hypothetical protein